MRKHYILTILSLFLGLISNSQSGDGHNPDLVLSYTPSGYSAATTMRQDDGYTTFSKNTINNNGGNTELFVNFTFDTSGMSVFVVYTTNGTAPTKSNGTSVSGSFSNFSDPNRTWTVEIPNTANTSGTTVEYVFYISNSDLASGFGRVTPGGGYQTSWSEGDQRGYTYVVRESNVSGGGNWSSTSTWNSGSVPNSSTLPVEIIGTNAVTLNQNADTENLNLLSGSIFNLSGGNGLNVSGNLSNSGTLTAESGSSLRVSGTSTGNITYNRALATNNWYLVASPVVGETAVDLISNAGDISFNGSEFAIGTYSDGWTYNYSATLGSGSGYAVKKDASGNLPFTGTLQTSDVAITTISTTDNFMLLGNPYTSFIAANSNADATNNLLTVNSQPGQDELEETTIWLWNQASDGYQQFNLASSALHLAPGQGFFVKVKSGFGDANFDITEAMQSHQGTDSFQRNTTTRPEVQLLMSNSSLTRDADIYYIDGTTTGFDNGYDSSIFDGVAQEFAVYTEAVANGTGKKLGIQSLPNSDLENMIIPLGVISDAGAVSFSVNASNLPQGYKVFLEDKDTGNFIRLDESGSKYDVTFDNAVDGIGRFFLHTTTSALSTGSFDATNVSAYISEKNNLKIVGIQSGTTQVRLFNILGKQVLNTSFQSKGVDNVTLPNVRTGVYIVQIVSEQGTINKKIVIE